MAYCETYHLFSSTFPFLTYTCCKCLSCSAYRDEIQYQLLYKGQILCDRNFGLHFQLPLHIHAQLHSPNSHASFSTPSGSHICPPAPTCPSLLAWPLPLPSSMVPCFALLQECLCRPQQDLISPSQVCSIIISIINKMLHYEWTNE